MQAQNTANASRRADNISMKQNRGPRATRTVAGANKVSTGQGTNANKIGQDPMMYSVTPRTLMQLTIILRQKQMHRKLRD